MKLRQRHGEINFSHYRHMPSILLNGFLAVGRKPNFLDFWWVSRADPKALFVVLKATRKREIYVETFHPIGLKEARRLLKRAEESGRLVRRQTVAGHSLQPGTNHLAKEKQEA